MKLLLSFFTFLFALSFSFSQNIESDFLLAKDSLYKEDQFYVAATFNLIAFKPKGSALNGFSSGIHFGFIKDMPLNKRRNIAIGLGLGLSFNSYNQSMLISKTEDEVINFSILDGAVFTKNKFSVHLLEVPLEFRWRTSTAETYKFWRIYGGFKFGYVFANEAKFIGEPSDIKLKGLDVFNAFQYGINLSVGYNTWNFYAYYGLNTIFNSESKINNAAIDSKALKIGLMFYML